MKNGIEAKISRNQFRGYSTDEKLDLIYNALLILNERVSALEKQSWIKSLWAFGGGVIGGALAYMGIKKI